MATRGFKSDIVIALHPQHVANIVLRVKNHEFRKYLLPPHIKRLWIYETSPASAIKYVATISAGKQPGEIRDSSGLRNDEFDQGKLEHLARYAYEIQKLEALPKIISLSDLKQNGWLNGPPQKYCYVKDAMDQALSALPLSLVFESTSSRRVPGHSSNLEIEPNQEKNQVQPRGIVKGQKHNSKFATMERLSHCGCSDNYASQPHISPPLLPGRDIA
ncbi:hypothetical protein RJZ56_007570 [Blastomyces dermatitidis]